MLAFRQNPLSLRTASLSLSTFFLIFVSMNLINKHIDQINNICSEHRVEQLFIFGSVVTNTFNEESDIDILIQFSPKINPLEYFDNYMDFKEKLEFTLNRKVDIVENQAVRNPIFRKILDRDKILIYERKTA
jgi:predicted nucleotidyltransferase